MSDAKPYLFYYWPSLPGRGEFPRLVLEAAGVPYVDVARLPEAQGGGTQSILQMMRGELDGAPPLAPPALKVGDDWVGQSSNICLFLARRHGLVPDDEMLQYRANQLDLTIGDLVSETHDAHHPIATGLHYESQKTEAMRGAPHFVSQRLPKFLGYLERTLRSSGGPFLLGDRLSYVDLSLFQLIEGLTFAFPRAMARLRPDLEGLISVCALVRALPSVAVYLASDRRLPFCQNGIFRRYPELDVHPAD